MKELTVTAKNCVFTPVYTDRVGNAIAFEPIKQADGTYLLVRRMSTDMPENTSAHN